VSFKSGFKWVLRALQERFQRLDDNRRQRRQPGLLCDPHRPPSTPIEACERRSRLRWRGHSCLRLTMRAGRNACPTLIHFVLVLVLVLEIDAWRQVSTGLDVCREWRGHSCLRTSAQAEMPAPHYALHHSGSPVTPHSGVTGTARPTLRLAVP
jgi:hypothetical protein